MSSPRIQAGLGVSLHGTKQIWSSRVVEAASRYGEHAPAAAVRCNACQTCLTTNLPSLATGAALAASFAIRRLGSLSQPST